MSSCIYIMQTKFMCAVVSNAFYERVLSEALSELKRGDNKYGPHQGPKRAFGALRAELMELQTELEAEDSAHEAICKEAIQVIAMGIKFIRDYANTAS